MSKKNSSSKRTAQKTETGIKDKSLYVHQRTKLERPLSIYMRYELKPKQQLFVDTALDKNTRLILCDGLWGSSKSYLSVYCALRLLNEKKVDSILYLRAPIEAGKEIGFIPGSIEEKMNPYAEPFFQKLHELLNENDIKMLEADNRLEVVPPGFIRGQSWNCKAVIIDEAANFPRSMLELILSRIGPFCKVFVIGSQHQSDTGDPYGFMSLFSSFDDEESRARGIHQFFFNEEEDIVRSEFTKFVMRKLGVLKIPEPFNKKDWTPSNSV